MRGELMSIFLVRLLVILYASRIMKQIEEINSQNKLKEESSRNNTLSKNGYFFPKLPVTSFCPDFLKLEDVMFVKIDTNPRENWVLEKPDYYTAWVRTKDGRIRIEGKTFDSIIKTAKELSSKYDKDILLYAVRDRSDACFGTYKKDNPFFTK